ncbi:MAG: leucyl/phenylalanyl-tRNA--protein transferase, partial [Methylotenera sp.]
IIDAYCMLHEAGYAISSEAWLAGKLVGGCYGVKIGGMFYGESMFHHINDASKVAFVHLVEYLQSLQVGMIDCQMKTAHLARFGAREISRTDFMQKLDLLCQNQKKS